MDPKFIFKSILILLTSALCILNVSANKIAVYKAAIEKGDTRVVQSDFHDNMYDIEMHDSDGCTLLWYTVNKGHLSLTKFLLENGANPDITCGYDKKAPLHIAADKGALQIVKVLLANGANPDISTIDYPSKKPLDYAFMHHYSQIIKALITGGANVNTQLSLNFTPILCKAIDLDDMELVKFLLDQRVNMSVRCAYQTPLEYARHKKQIYNLLQKAINDEL